MSEWLLIFQFKYIYIHKTETFLTQMTAMRWTQTHNHLVCLQTKWLWVRVPLQSLKTSDTTPILSKEFLDIQANIEREFTLKCVRDMT